MSDFSDFIRNATPEEKAKVYDEVMKRASERQNAAPQVAPSACHSDAGSAQGGSAIPAEAAPEWKYVCDDDCRSPRCPAALERIAAGWRNGRDKE